MNLSKLILVNTLFFIAASAWASDRERLLPLFSDRYHNAYFSGRCGDNIINFLRKANEQGIDTRNISMVLIQNKGFSGFGMVNAEAARDSVRGVPVASEKNWYHHVIAIDSEGFVYDFDYTERPLITDLNTYAEKMFLNEPECIGGRPSGEFCIGRTDKLNDYTIKIIPSDVAISGEDDATELPSVNLKSFLQNWKDLLKGRP